MNGHRPLADIPPIPPTTASAGFIDAGGHRRGTAASKLLWVPGRRAKTFPPSRSSAWPAPKATPVEKSTKELGRPGRCRGGPVPSPGGRARHSTPSTCGGRELPVSAGATGRKERGPPGSSRPAARQKTPPIIWPAQLYPDWRHLFLSSEAPGLFGRSPGRCPANENVVPRRDPGFSSTLSLVRKNGAAPSYIHPKHLATAALVPLEITPEFPLDRRAASMPPVFGGFSPRSSAATSAAPRVRDISGRGPGRGASAAGASVARTIRVAHSCRNTVRRIRRGLVVPGDGSGAPSARMPPAGPRARLTLENSLAQAWWPFPSRSRLLGRGDSRRRLNRLVPVPPNWRFPSGSVARS